MPRPDPISIATNQKDSAPCVGCGLCCDGTLHHHVVLSSQEADEMRSLGHELSKDGANDRLSLPCTYFSCGSCTNYEGRFAACRSYECALLRRYHAGELGLAEARSIIEEARERIETAAAANPGCAMKEMRVATRKILEERVKKAPPDEKAAIGRQLLSLAALDYFLSAYFEVTGKQRAAADCADPMSKETGHEFVARR